MKVILHIFLSRVLSQNLVLPWYSTFPMLRDGEAEHALLVARVLRRAVDHLGVDVDVEAGAGMNEECKAQKTKQKEVRGAG